MWKISCCIISLIFASVTARHVTILGPLVSTGGNTYKAFVAASGLPSNDELAVLLNCNGYIQKEVFSLNENEFEAKEIEFKLPHVELGACQFYSVVRQGSYCTKDEIHIENKLDNFLLIQTDKSVYKPGDNVTYQVIALNSQTKPVPFKNIQIELFDGSKNLVLSTKLPTEAAKENFGFFENQIMLSNEPNLGTWTLKATIDELNATSTKTFQVNFYTLPAFKFYIETNPKLSFNENDLTLNLFAKYSFDKFVKGKANVTTTIRPQSKPDIVLNTFQKTVDITNDKTQLKINLKSDLMIKFMVKNVIAVVEAEFEEANTGVKTVQSRQVLIFPTGKHIINVDKKEKFRPGFGYKINVAVTTFDGLPEKSESIPITLGQKYEYEGGQYGSNAEITSASFLKNGSAQFIIYPAKNAKSLELTVSYDNSKVLDKIHRIEHSTTNEFMQAFVLTENPVIGDLIDINVQCNSILENLYVVVFGKSGIVFSRTFADFGDKSDANISFKLTEEMAPTANIILFYLRGNDGSMIYDKIELDLEFTGNNFLSLDTSSTPKKIRQNVQIGVRTQPNSLVALLAVDQSVTFMGTENIISQSFVNLKLHPEASDYPYKKDDKRFVFGNTNAFKISPTSEIKRFCLREEERLFDLFRVAAVEGTEWRDDGPTYEAGEAQEITRKNFPEVWFQEVQEVEHGSFNFLKKLPDSITTWIVNGYSINPQHGFAVAMPMSINVFKDFFIRIEKPHTAKLKEIVTIKVIIHNYMNTNAQTSITLNNPDRMFEIIEGNKVKTVPSKTLSTYAKTQNTAVVIFKIRPVESGKIKFEINAKSTNAEDNMEDYFTVSDPRPTKTIIDTKIIDLNNQTSFSDEMTFQPIDAALNSITFEVVTSSDLLGPALDNVENLIEMPEGCGEQKMRIISSTIMAIKYLEATSQLAELDKKRLERILTKSYQDLIALQNKDGSFNLWATAHKFDANMRDQNWQQPRDYLDLTAYIVKLLSQFDTIQPLPDKKVIKKAMKYIASKQKPDGSFETGDGAQFKDLKVSSNIEGVSLTAYILIGILENENLKADYPQLVTNALNFIESKFYDILHDGTNYERALTFYIYALTGKDHQLMLKKLNENALRSDGKIYWNLRDQTESSASVQVEISSYVVLALTKLRNYQEAKEIVKFLMSKKTIKGGFASTTDTVLGLHALAEISKLLYSKDTNINLNLRNQFNEEVRMTANKNHKRSTSKDLQGSSRFVAINANGKGVASLQISCTYKQKINNNKIFFDLFVNARKDQNNFLILDVCVKTKGNQKSNMAVVEIELPSGYTHRHGPKQNSDEIKKIDRKNDGAKLLVYLGEVSSTEICLSDIEAVQTSQVENLKSSEVKIYDYYEPERMAIEHFNV